MTTKAASRVRPGLVDRVHDDKPGDAVQARARGATSVAMSGVGESSEMFTLMLADMDNRLAAIEQRTDRIAAHAA